MDAAASLASPLPLPSGAVLPNRLVKASMSEVLADPQTGEPSDALARVYERWGRGGAGMLLTGNVIVDFAGRTEPGNVVIRDERHLPGLRRWAEAGQADGAKMWMQISHAGRQTPKKLARVPVSPSDVGLRGMYGLYGKPRALAGHEIEDLVARFGFAAGLAKEAGFSGVQIHGAHGYLVSQFLSPLANRRDDEWGGDPERRRRFLLEIVRAIKRNVGPEFPVGVKLNSADFQRGGFTIEESMDVARALEAEGVDLLEVSGGNYERPAMMSGGEIGGKGRASTERREAYFLEYARRIRDVTKMPLMLTGGLRSAAAMTDAIASGAVDAIGLGRPLAYEPDLPARLLAGTSERALAVKLTTGLRKLDDLLQLMWFQAQIHRMGEGRDPDPQLGKLRALAFGFGNMLRTRHRALAPASTVAEGA
ncbi:MAG TPA: NADH:flavin oxidoreductase/NADH oxidase family protein [Nannocystaceae bacterium]|nr:NADH:flavin oxidoreductase/NADH oxidase family protein [Nannocystaceae bacterium]